MTTHITDEKLAELDDWYSKCSSNSLMFCDADYLAIRARLKMSEAQRNAALTELVVLETHLAFERAKVAELRHSLHMERTVTEMLKRWGVQK